MTPRSVAEWIGAYPEQAVPLRVRLRIMERQNCRCAVCGWDLSQRPLIFDHRPALINGGENRESMIQAICAPCHKPLTKADVKEKSKVAALRVKHLGLKKSKHPMAGSRSSPWKRKLDGSWVRREKS